jgi:V8-like Glu-specific endopeptidase
MKTKRWMLSALALSFLFICGSVNAQQEKFATSRNKAPGSAYSTPYWTPQRMAAARPMPLLVRQGSLSPVTDGTDLKVTGPAEKIAGHAPGNETVPNLVSLTVGGDETLSAPLANYFIYPFPFTRTEVNPTTLYTVYPWSTNGKLYGTMPGQGNYVCSATAITSGTAPRRALVLTAGHCISDGQGTFAYNFMFVPAMRDTSAPFGVWDWEFATTTNEWHNNGNFRRDVAFIVTSKRPSDGRSLGSVVGDAGLGWNFPDKQDLWVHGYPSRAPFNGKRMILCTSAIAARDSPPGVGPATIAIGCDQTQGSSGGSWKRAWSLNGSGYAIGVVSYGKTGQSQALYSPYFDTAIRDLWTHAQTLVSP